MSWNAISAALAARITAVPGIGKVHPYQRFVQNPPGSATFKSIFEDTDGVLNVWMVVRPHRDAVYTAGEGWRITHQVMIRGLFGLWDPAATGISFEDIVEAVAEDLRTGDRTLGGVAETLSDVVAESSIGEMQKLTENFHYAQIHLNVYEAK